MIAKSLLIVHQNVNIIFKPKSATWKNQKNDLLSHNNNLLKPQDRVLKRSNPAPLSRISALWPPPQRIYPHGVEDLGFWPVLCGFGPVLGRFWLVVGQFCASVGPVLAGSWPIFGRFGPGVEDSCSEGRIYSAQSGPVAQSTGFGPGRSKLAHRLPDLSLPGSRIPSLTGTARAPR